MVACTVRWVSVGLLASACAVVMETASALNAAPALGDDATTALIMGDAFLATPNDTYMTQVMNTYIDPATPFFNGQTVYPGATAVAQFTPETDYGTGLTQGVADLDQGISQSLGDGGVVVFGYSESTAVATQEMINLDTAGAANSDGANPLSFVLLEDLNNPNGGFFTRFPSIGLPATPGDTPYTTDIYSIEYSAASAFPQYDGNLMADLNAEAGYLELHPYLLADYPSTYTASALSGAVLENTSSADLATDYYLIPTQDLPMLAGLRDLSPAMADLIQPDERVLVDLGYNWTGDADVATAATMSNPNIDTTAVDADLAAGADQGMIAALVDLGLLPQSDLADISELYPYVPDVSGLISGSVYSDALATADASTSLAALTSDLSASNLADVSSSLIAAATQLADMFASSVGSL